MGNCLVTKLKGTVDNPNLPLFGYVKITRLPSSLYYSELLFHVSKGTATITVNFVIKGDYVIKVLNAQTGTFEELSAGKYSRSIPGTYFIWVSGTDGSVEVDVASISDCFVWVGSGYRCHLPLHVFGSYGPMVCFRINEYSFYEEGSTLKDYLAAKDAAGALQDIRYVNLFHTNITSALTTAQILDYFGRAIAIETISITDTTWDILAVADAQVANGRSSGTLRAYNISESKTITFDPSAPGGYIIN